MKIVLFGASTAFDNIYVLEQNTVKFLKLYNCFCDFFNYL